MGVIQLFIPAIFTEDKPKIFVVINELQVDGLNECIHTGPA